MMLVHESDDVFKDDHEDDDADDEKENVKAGKRNQQVHHHLMPVIMCKYNPMISSFKKCQYNPMISLKIHKPLYTLLLSGCRIFKPQNVIVYKNRDRYKVCEDIG